MAVNAPDARPYDQATLADIRGTDHAYFGNLGYWPRRASASRMGALEILIAPLNGLFNSSMAKIEPETDSAQTSKVTRTVALLGANNAKLRKMIAIQKINTASNSVGTVLSASAINSQRVCARSSLSDSACD